LSRETAAELYRKGHAMHHCVGSYADKVRSGEVYVFGIHRNAERVGTIALDRAPDARPGIVQARGPCNAGLPSEIMRAVLKWLRSLPPLPPSQNALSSPLQIGDEANVPEQKAHERGVQARAQGLSRRSIPREYLRPTHATEALNWVRGWDGNAPFIVATKKGAPWEEIPF
jgi:hypothetical protein